jgi:hypothetical protein
VTAEAHTSSGEGRERICGDDSIVLRPAKARQIRRWASARSVKHSVINVVVSSKQRNLKKKAETEKSRKNKTHVFRKKILSLHTK